MNTLETMNCRKSIRYYTGEKVTDEELNKILTAAQEVPMGMGDYSSVHITVISNEELIEEINNNAETYMKKPGARPLNDAPQFIIISSKIQSGMENMNYSNCAIIVENIALAATELEIGSCCKWGVVSFLNKNKELVEKLNLPEGYIPCCGIIIGKTNEKYEKRESPKDRIAINIIKQNKCS